MLVTAQVTQKSRLVLLNYKKYNNDIIKQMISKKDCSSLRSFKLEIIFRRPNSENMWYSCNKGKSARTYAKHDPIFYLKFPDSWMTPFTKAHSRQLELISKLKLFMWQTNRSNYRFGKSEQWLKLLKITVNFCTKYSFDLRSIQ